ncbi:MAG: DNA repair protein RecN [Erysipelotrichaceae bacterium]|nr:DNA repair protein RecN [Erysipelotrichaceae bacterium]
MLKHLYIKDYVIINELNIDFDNGMSVFTGETGAGKSIIIDAIDLLCGSRLTHDVVSSKADKAIIEGVFTIENHQAISLLNDAGIELSDEYIISRHINKDGKSTMRLNYRIITQTLANEVLSHVIDIHNQHETQYLLNTKTHRQLLDRFINDQALMLEVKNKYIEYETLDNSLKKLLKNDLNQDDLEFLTFQKEEIEKANIYESEYDDLIVQQKKMAAFEKTSQNLNEICELLNRSEGVLEKYYLANKLLKELDEDQKLVNVHKQLTDRYFEVEELANQLDNYLNDLSFDEDQLNLIQERLYFINKMYRKYGDSYQKIQIKYQEICDRIDMINDRQSYIEKAQKLVDKAYTDYQDSAKRLTNLRRIKAVDLKKQVMEQLADLQLSNTEFDIAFNEQKPSSYGNETVEFMISTNKGQPLNSLNKIASGGELSRIMLGLKTIFNNLHGISTIIFDEIDSGVSGSIATAIGLKMHFLSKNAQVFAVTHLGQVAACADNHYYIAKESTENNTTSSIKLLDNDERIRELALIATGKITQASLLAAEELLNHNQSLIRESIC